MSPLPSSGSANGTEQFRQAAKALNEAADAGLRKEVYAGFRKAVKPLGERMIREGAALMPRRGGFAERIAKSKVSQSNATTGRNPGVSMTLRSAQGYNLKALDAGVLRHPVFARAGVKKVWKQQAVPAGGFSKPFEAGADDVRKQIVESIEKVNEQIVRQSGGIRGSGSL